MGPSLCLSQVGVLLKWPNVGSHKQKPHNSSGTLVFWCQRYPRNFTGVTPLRGRQIQVEWVKIGNFRQITGYISNTVKDGHIHPFNGPLSGTTQVSRYQKGKTNLDFTEARDSEWQWHLQVCTSLQTDNHASTPPLSFLQAGCPSCRPTNSVKALGQHQCLLCCFGFILSTVLSG